MIVPLEAAVDEGRFGGKAAQLCTALRAGLPVPPGFALGLEATRALVERGDQCAGFDELTRAFGAMRKPVAVRSSAVGEDSGAASFAGQHATVLGVSDETGLLAAVQRVWQSGHTDAARAYRRTLGLALDAQMGVVVQELVRADVAGVLFTRHPVSGADERVIEAAWGLGEVVVAGLVTPDNYRLARGGRVLGRTLGDKDIELGWSPAGGTEEREVPVERAGAFCLDGAKLARLDALATQCEAAFPGAHDIEFAFDGDALFLLQRRAITRD